MLIQIIQYIFVNTYTFLLIHILVHIGPDAQIIHLIIDLQLIATINRTNEWVMTRMVHYGIRAEMPETVIGVSAETSIAHIVN